MRPFICIGYINSRKNNTLASFLLIQSASTFLSLSVLTSFISYFFVFIRNNPLRWTHLISKGVLNILRTHNNNILRTHNNNILRTHNNNKFPPPPPPSRASSAEHKPSSSRKLFDSWCNFWVQSSLAFWGHWVPPWCRVCSPSFEVPYRCWWTASCVGPLHGSHSLTTCA